MKNLLYILPIAFLLLITSCGDDTVLTPDVQTADVNITFKGMFGDQELDLNSTTYDYMGNPITFSKLDFFAYSLSLYGGDGSEQTELSEIEFIDLNNAETEFVLSINNVPVGDYNGISLSIGVPSDLNAMIPADFSDTHPLGFSNVSHHWADWDSYIFSKLEGRLEVNNDNMFFSYHTGSDPLFKSGILKSSPMTLTSGTEKNITVYIDVEKLLANGGGLDIEMYPDSHSLSELTAATHIMDNFSSAISVD